MRGMQSYIAVTCSGLPAAPTGPARPPGKLTAPQSDLPQPAPKLSDLGGQASLLGQETITSPGDTVGLVPMGFGVWVWGAVGMGTGQLRGAVQGQEQWLVQESTIS